MERQYRGSSFKVSCIGAVRARSRCQNRFPVEAWDWLLCGGIYILAAFVVFAIEYALFYSSKHLFGFMVVYCRSVKLNGRFILSLTLCNVSALQRFIC